MRIRQSVEHANDPLSKKRWRIYQYWQLTARRSALDASLGSKSQGGLAQKDGVLVRIFANPARGRRREHLFRPVGAFAIGWGSIPGVYTPGYLLLPLCG